jgi:mRNA interferase MazF
LYETQNIIDSAKEQIYLQGKTHKGNRAKPRRGQVFHSHLGVGVGSEFQKRRPCVVLSNTVSNINSSVIVIAPITHTHKKYPIFVPIEDKLDTNGEVILSGYADLSNVRAISSYRLAGLICELDSGEMKQIDAAMARHLDLMHHYNTLVKVIEDKEKHVDLLSNVLSELHNLTGTEDNQELLKAVEQMVAEKRKNDS